MRTRIALGILLATALAPGADAALKKYRLKLTNMTMSPSVSPFPDNAPGANTPASQVLIDDSAIPGNPVLKRMMYVTDNTTTTKVPGLSLNIFVSNNFREGPGGAATDPKPQTFTGTGSTAAGSTVVWGVVTGWTITGSFWCHAAPPVVCDLAEGDDQSTVDPIFTSDFFDLGTWTYHSTGFTATPFVFQYFTVTGPNSGNRVFHFRGFRVFDGLVPALPLAGVVLLGGSLAVGAAVALRRRDP